MFEPATCQWETVEWDGSNLVTTIWPKTKGIRGTPDLQNLTDLTMLEFFEYQISGSILDLTGLTRL